jgi:hypothetical protein
MNRPSPLLQLSLGSLLLLVVTTIASCGATGAPLVAQGLVEGEPCSPPCFQGLVPGSSTEDDVRQFLRSGRYAVGPYAVIERSEENVLIMMWDRRGLGGQRNEFQIRGNILSLTSMYLDSHVTLEQVVKRYGAPDKFTAGLNMSGRVYTLVGLFYREVGMIVDLYVYDDVPQLKPDTKVARVWYFDPVPLEQAILVLAGKKGQALEDFELEQVGHWHEWAGYGVVEPDHSHP